MFFFSFILSAFLFLSNLISLLHSSYICPSHLSASLWFPLTPSRHAHSASSFSSLLTLISKGSTPVLQPFFLTTYFAPGLPSFLLSYSIVSPFPPLSPLFFHCSITSTWNATLLVLFHISSVCIMFLSQFSPSITEGSDMVLTERPTLLELWALWSWKLLAPLWPWNLLLSGALVCSRLRKNRWNPSNLTWKRFLCLLWWKKTT